jgi:hypothetical protein
MLRRAIIGALVVGAMLLHSLLLDGVPNSPMGMLMFHGSAATFDLALLFACQNILLSDTSFDIEMLCMASILVNFLGWLAYLAYAPSVFYNSATIILTIILAARLLMVSNNGGHTKNNSWLSVVRNYCIGRSKQNIKGANKCSI